MTHDYRRYICTACGRSVDVPVRCGDRFCSVCARSTRIRARERIDWILKTIPRPNGELWRFVTLTIPNQPDPSVAVDILVKSFRRMRTDGWWQHKVTAGIYVIELKPGTEGWHVHIHALVLGWFMPQRKLVELWSKFSPGKIVDIRKTYGLGLAGYLTKYMTKAEMSDADSASVATALAGRRMFSAFAQAHHVNITYVRPKHCCTACGGTDWYWLGGPSRWLCDQSTGTPIPPPDVRTPSPPSPQTVIAV